MRDPEYYAELAKGILSSSGPGLVPGEVPTVDRQADLAGELLTASQSLGSDPALLDACIALLDDAVRRCPRRHPRRAGCVFNLSRAYSARYDIGDDPADLRNAVYYGEQVLAALSPRAHGWADTLYHLSVVYRKRYELLHNGSDLNRAIVLGRQAVSGRKGGAAVYRSSLATAYGQRYDRAGDVGDLDRAIRHAERAVAETPENDHHRPGVQHNLAYLRRKRHERTGNLADLDRAIELGEQIDATAPPRHLVRLDNLSSLGLAYRARFELTSDTAALDRAIEVGERAVAAAPEGSAVWTRYVGNLVQSLQHRHRHRGDPEDLRRIERLEEARAETAHGGSSTVANAHLQHYAHDGDTADLDLAVDIQAAGMATLTQRSPARPQRLAGLSRAHWSRYGRLGVLIDLVRSVELAELAVRLTPADHPDHARQLAGLTPAYTELFERTGVPAQLDRAIWAGERAVEGTPEGRYDYPDLLSHLSIGYVRRYFRDHLPADLDRAVELGERALAAIPDTHTERAGILANLAGSYGARHRRDGNRADLDRAVELSEQSVAALPDGDWKRPLAVANLAHNYQALHEADPGGFDPVRLRGLVRVVDELAAAAPADRVRFGYAVGELALDVGDSETAVSLLDDAVALLSTVPPREGDWVDQEFRLGSYPGLIGAAISAHCATGDAGGAVTVAESGRGIMLASRLDLRTDLSELARVEPELARRLGQVRDRLNAIDGPSRSTVELASRTEQRRALWLRHDELLAEIRRLPGFAQFLLAPSLPDLRSAAAGGAIVLVNASSHRADAVIVTPSDLRLIPLPELRFSDVLRHAGSLLEVTHVPGLVNTLRRQRIVPEVLAWLWDTVVSPVVDALPTRRVWWMPTGLLGVLPLHAAGHPGRPGALDAVTSSYTATVRTLADARTRTPSGARRQLTVALRHTPGLPDLPGTVAEADELQDQWGNMAPLRDDRASVAAVLAALPKATWAHFACHAGTNPMFPTAGGLHLHDGVLSAPTIGQLRLGSAELAYLSACSTGNRGIRAEDEAIHPASAFQLAGFRHVVASLWPVEDRIAAVAARSFYRFVDQDTPASALRRVALDLREAHPGRPDLWASLIHTGP
ncbi:CHAT domain-containing protein [Kutzneria kofuensis]|uniref:CHAT domain-containing protein n=1 Tax=Kutzneria kofuensis TaxID=103725 RepID=A0A7W9KC87_9PSEU|nr:CHAT domain-containing protein [Kutzneria kofuensis]MBB5889159.1 hypothetical protein [Kutzneria kofuensis]